MNTQLNHTIARQPIADLARVSARPWQGWMAVAAVLVGAGWGSNQFTPMLLVYRHALGLGAGSLEAMFGVYTLGFDPGSPARRPAFGRSGAQPAGARRGGDVVGSGDAAGGAST